MQTNGCPEMNGGAAAVGGGDGLPSTSHMNGAHESNGTTVDCDSTEAVPFHMMSRVNQDIIRLIGQHLRTLGLKYVYFSPVYVLKYIDITIYS